MTKIDKSYLEKLGEILHDEKKAMNYKTVSIALGVHVNIAKQMLYHMYKTSKAEGKQVHATYYVSGMVSRTILRSLGSQEREGTGDDNFSAELPMDHLDAYLVSICREKDLEKIKSKYTKIFSIHIYSLSAFPLENYDALENLVEFPIKDSEGRTPVDFGPIISSASQKLKDNTRSVRAAPKSDTVFNSRSNQVSKDSESNKKQEVHKEPQSNGNKQPKDNLNKDKSENLSQKLAKPITTEKKDGNRLKSMFATASTKPKSSVKSAPNSKPTDVEVKDDPKPETKKAKSVSNKGKEKETRKRKRIRDVLSSDSEEETKMSEDEAGSSPGSPVPRKRIQIDSDSEDDSKHTSSSRTKEEISVMNDGKNVVPGIRRVVKTISKSHVDKDGYLVTTKEQVMVSEDEDDVKEKKGSQKPDLDALKPTGSQSSSNKVTEKTPVKSSQPGKHGAGKTKQPSLMSFFQKK